VAGVQWAKMGQPHSERRSFPKNDPVSMPGLKSFWIKSPESENMPETRQTKHFFTFGTEEEQVIFVA